MQDPSVAVIDCEADRDQGSKDAPTTDRIVGRTDTNNNRRRKRKIKQTKKVC